LLFTIDGKPIRDVPRARAEYFRAVKNWLGDNRTQEVQAEFDWIIDELPPDPGTGKRTFNSSYLGSNLSPWEHPLALLYEAATHMAGAAASEQEIQEQSGFSFGLFAWECIIQRDEEWALYNPNLPGDVNSDVMGKVYFER
jgi:hypothetical protein